MSQDATAGGNLSPPEYESLVDAAETYRSRLVVRLCGEAGLRASEVVDVRPSDRRDVDSYRGSLLRVRSDGRTAYLPPELDMEFVRYVNSNSVSDDGRLVDVSERRVQMLVGEAGESAGVDDVSPSDLRELFARRALMDGVDPLVVKEAGGWSSLASLERYIDGVDGEGIAAGFEDTSSSGDSTFLPFVEGTVDADSRDEMTELVVDRLGSDYAFAWSESLSVDGDASVDIRSGASNEVVEEARAETSDATHGPVFVENAVDGKDVLAVPMSHEGKRYGILGVATEDGFEAEEYDRLEVLGSLVGHALTAEQRRKALSSDSVLEVELRTSDTGDFLVDLSERFGCEFTVRSVVSASETLDLFHVTATGSHRTRVLEESGDIEGVNEVRLVEQDGSNALIEFGVSGASVVRLLHGYGADVRDAVFEDGEGRIVADCAYGTELQTVVGGVKDAHPETHLVGKKEVDRDTRPTESFVEDVSRRLTDRQEEALRAAYFGGYFDWPRGSTAEEIADSMDVSSPTLHNHLRKGQREILSALFDR